MINESLPTINSTNEYLKKKIKLASLMPSPYAIVSEEQSGGYGQHKRSWYSPRGGLYFSFYAKCNEEAQVLLEKHLTLEVGNLLKSCVETITALSCQIKEPNDIYVQGKKLAGILVETVSRGKMAEAVIIGVGLNVNTMMFPEELSATSLKIETGRDYDIKSLANNLYDDLCQTILPMLE
jgi:BirA family transcriptional regulator, biotin operon repressor / biotin---[acetyl-CoA-carboxylase] ligase